VDGKSLMHFTEDFLLVSVIEGRGRMISQEGVFLFVKGDHFMLPHRFGPFRLVGKTKWILAAPASTNNKLNIYS
jgi:mannose-6-phosphate isomerase